MIMIIIIILVVVIIIVSVIVITYYCLGENISNGIYWGIGLVEFHQHVVLAYAENVFIISRYLWPPESKARWCKCVHVERSKIWVKKEEKKNKNKKQKTKQKKKKQTNKQTNKQKHFLVQKYVFSMFRNFCTFFSFDSYW